MRGCSTARFAGAEATGSVVVQPEGWLRHALEDEMEVDGSGATLSDLDLRVYQVPGLLRTSGTKS